MSLPDDPMLVFYLLILLIGVGSFFFGDFRNRLSENLRNAAVWVIIFLGAVTLYGFKDTLGSQLFPSAAVQTEGDTIILNRARDGHFYANVAVNGTDVRFIVDTGATSIVMSLEDADRIGLNREDLRFIGQARTANGTVDTAPVRLETVVFGGRTDTNLRASVNAGELGTSLLGMSYLSRFSRIEIEGTKLRLVP